jgi:hypothetical protein
MYRNFKLHILILPIILLLTNCKKKEDNLSPVLNILSPTEASDFNVDEEIKVKVSCSDDKEVKFIKAGINDQNSVAISAAQLININKKNSENIFSFKLNNVSATAEKCYIVVLVSDGEKETKKYVEININAIPKIATGFITTHVSGSTTGLTHYSLDGALQNSQNCDGEIKDGDFFATQQVWIGYSSDEGAKAFKLPDFNQVWSYNLAQIENFTRNSEQIFLIKSDHYTAGFNIDDFSIFRNYYEPSFTYHPKCAATNENIFCAFHMQINVSEPKKIIVFDFISSNILKELLIQDEVKSLEWLNNNIFVAHIANFNNNHNVALFDADANTLNTIYNASSNIKSILKLDNTNVLILSDEGVGILNILNHGYQTIISKTNIVDMAFETVSDQIYIVIGNKIEKYNLNGNVLATYQLNNQPNTIHLTYNK